MVAFVKLMEKSTIRSQVVTIVERLRVLANFRFHVGNEKNMSRMFAWQRQGKVVFWRRSQTGRFLKGSLTEK